MMMFTQSTHKIIMSYVLQFGENPGGKNSSFLVMTQSENEIDEGD